MKKGFLLLLVCTIFNSWLHAETHAVVTVSIQVTFSDGSGFTPIITKGGADQALGRFRLAGNISGGKLTAASIKLNDARTGLSNLKLWSSADGSFGGDTQLGATVAADPGNGNSVSFSGFSNSIATSGTYYFLTGDVAIGATGYVQAVITANTSLTISPGSLISTISNAPLSLDDVSLPVGLVSFSGRAEGCSVVLNWATESELNNAGFILDRSEETGAWVQIASYQINDELKGRGNCSSASNYAFTDRNVESGKNYAYRLSDVSTGGEIKAYDPLSVFVKMNIRPGTTEMDKAYPNPFNPRTFISYRLGEDTHVEISVLNILGHPVRSLYHGRQSAGNYHVYWNGTDETGLHAPSGVYLIRMTTEETSLAQRVMMLK
jgi:hypothetical protein